MPDPALALEAVEVRYGSVPAVQDLTLQVSAGEIVGLIGPNGAGKSTSLHAIMGLLPLHGGEIRLKGAPLAGRSPESIAKAGVAILLVEQRAQRTVALADRTHVLVGGLLRMTLGPADADDTDKIVAAYLSA